MPRQTPHDFTSVEFAKVIIADHENAIARSSAIVLDADKDEVLDNHIFSLSIELPQLALISGNQAALNYLMCVKPDAYIVNGSNVADIETVCVLYLCNRQDKDSLEFFDRMSRIDRPGDDLAKERGYMLELVNDYVPPDLLDAVLARQIKPEPPKPKSGLSRFWRRAG